MTSAGQRGEARQVVGRGRADPFHGLDQLSWAILFRIVRRPRVDAS